MLNELKCFFLLKHARKVGQKKKPHVAACPKWSPVRLQHQNVGMLHLHFHGVFKKASLGSDS